jgi:predicted acetyltransferase
MATASIRRADPADKEILRQLLEFNGYEFSRFFDDAELDAHGRFGYPYLDHYWTEPDRHPFLIMSGEHVAGFTLVRAGDPHSIAEFLVLPKYRRGGIGTTAAREVFAMFPGRWDVHQIAGNDGATAFWRNAIPVEFTETRGSGHTQHFTIS